MIDELNWLLDSLKDVYWSSLFMFGFRFLYFKSYRILKLEGVVVIIEGKFLFFGWEILFWRSCKIFYS